MGRTLRQGRNSSKRPIILSYVLSLINEYKGLDSNYKPCFYERLNSLAKLRLDISYSSVVSILKENVRHRFLKLGKEDKSIYDYFSDDENLIFAEGVCKQISEYQDILHESILFRWAKILEDINRTTPRIVAKLKIRQDGQRRTSSLKKFHEWLLIENPHCECAICGIPVKDKKELSVDHVIPWSFLYSDDIWNLSFVHKSCNSQKQNTPPTRKDIIAQERRNKNLHELITTEYRSKMSNKIFKELDFSLQDNTLNKMWSIYKL